MIAKGFGPWKVLLRVVGVVAWWYTDQVLDMMSGLDELQLVGNRMLVSLKRRPFGTAWLALMAAL